MKNTTLAVLLALVANMANAQTWFVYGLIGQVEDVTTGKPRLVKLRDALHPGTILKIPKEGCVVLLDRDKGLITLDRVGTATIKDMTSNGWSSLKNRTSEFVSFLWKQVSSGGQVRLRNCSDAAVVTRELGVAKNDTSELVVCGTEKEYSALLLKHEKFRISALRKHEAFRDSALRKHEAFRDSALRRYAEFVRNPWKKTKLLPAEGKPQDEKIKPFFIDDKGGKAVIPDFEKDYKEQKTQPVISILPVPQPLPTPEPVAPIKENRDVNQYRNFTFFGTEMKVRWSDDCKFQLRGTDENTIADGVGLLSAHKYNNLLYDCIQLRTQYQLSDWGYYLMLKEVSATLLGKDTNEATLLMAMLYSQSGYKMRLALADSKLLMMISTQFYLYDYRPSDLIDGSYYYLIEGNYENVYICEASFEKEQEMSLVMRESPRFQMNSSEERTITSTAYPELHASVSVNKNLMDFYETYPSSYFNNDFMTRWAMYANIEMQPEVREQLYPQLKALIEGKSQRDAAGCILRWIQTGFEYEYDEDVWGHDRAFFAEESLFYPSCDCEDRSILYTRLIRDIMGLKCILVYYPGHLACAVCFTEEVEGDYIDVNGDRFTVCDPTILGGHGTPVGWTMQGMDNSTATVIVLE